MWIGHYPICIERKDTFYWFNSDTEISTEELDRWVIFNLGRYKVSFLALLFHVKR
jgi:hypothetical protein